LLRIRVFFITNCSVESTETHSETAVTQTETRVAQHATYCFGMQTKDKSSMWPMSNLILQ